MQAPPGRHMMVVGHARKIGQGNSSNQSQRINYGSNTKDCSSICFIVLNFISPKHSSLSLNLQFHSSIIRYRGRRHTYSCSRIGSPLPCGPGCSGFLCQHPSGIHCKAQPTSLHYPHHFLLFGWKKPMPCHPN